MSRSRRHRSVRCGRCALLPALCLCGDIARIGTFTNVVVVQHANEVHRTSNTGRLLPLVLERATVHVRDPRRPLPALAAAGTTAVLLFPAARGAVTTPVAAIAGPLTLVVPDATWREARRMVRRDPALALLPRVGVGGSGGYDLRVAPHSGQLATFEAVAAALRVVEGGAVGDNLDAVLATFLTRSRQTREGRVPTGGRLAAGQPALPGRVARDKRR